MYYISFSGYYASVHTGKSKERITSRYEVELCTTDNAQGIFDDQVYNCINGSVLFSRPGQRRQTVGNFEGHSVHFACHDEEFCRKYLTDLPTQIFNVDVYKFTQYLKDINFLRQSLKTEYSEANKLLLDTKLTGLLLELYTQSQAQIASSDNNKYAVNIAAACQFISEHFQEPVTIEDISGAAGLSDGFTYVMFKKLTGETPHDFLLNKRIHYACEQLIYTSKNITEISLASGFANMNYLNYIFSKRMGMTPGQYRKKYRRIV